MVTGRLPFTAGLALAVVGATLTLAPPAHAATPGYLCDIIQGTTTPGPGEGATLCTTFGGAPSTGTLTTTFLIVRRSDARTLTCVPVAGIAGVAAVPTSVTGVWCTLT
ncbi:hypothetical protein [Streptomyces sp. NPDC088789]|uniref:hypothetical protein n=1 Tax=Streptomyces sp. NPDC088789 TaxID=3365899 RepID=UPI003824A21D